MKNFLWIVLIIIVSLVSVKFIENNSYSDGVKYFLSLVENNEGAKATGFVLNNFSSKDWESLVKLIDRESEKIPSLYIMLVSDYVYTKDKDKAVEYFYIGRLRAKEDVFMCKDTTARQQIYIYPKAAPNTLTYAEQRIFVQNDKEYLANVLQKALKWDKSHPKRYDPTWACYHGINTFIKPGKPELVSKEEREKIIQTERQYVENTIRDLKADKINLKK